MTIKDNGYGSLYHTISVFELNDHLRDFAKDCNGVAKSTHIVLYGYIDPEDGFSFELLGTGSQNKYFNFKEPYAGTRKHIKLSEVDNVAYDWFEKIEPRFQKMFQPRIDIVLENEADDAEIKWKELKKNLPFAIFDLNQYINMFFESEDNEEKNKILTAIFTILRNSPVYVICDINPGESEGSELNVDPLFHTNNEGKMEGGVFATKDDFADYKGATLRVPFAKAIEILRAANEELTGITINPFSEGLFIPVEWFDDIINWDYILDNCVDDDFFEIDFGESNEAGEEDVSVNASRFNIDEESEKSGIALSVGKMDVFNFALSVNKVPAIRGVEIINVTGDPVDELILTISSDFHFFKKFVCKLPEIPSGKPVLIDDPELIVNGYELAKLTESITANILIEVLRGEERVCKYSGEMKVLAYDRWQGSESYRDLLPAFVMPNHPLIPALMHDASSILKKWGKKSSLEGYQEGDPNRVRELAAAAYAAIQKKNIIYANPPASFEIEGQRIRTPEVIMEQRLGTCMDMTLLYCSLLEAMGLHPILTLLQGHIFAGIWLKERTQPEVIASDLVIKDIQQLTMRIDNGADELTFVECTCMNSSSDLNYDEAEERGKMNLSDSSKFDFAIDVFIARYNKVLPIPSRTVEDGAFKIDIIEKTDAEISEAPQALDISISNVEDAKPRKITGKRELWESKLLDLSTHNMLLNLPRNSSIMPIMSSHIDELEDALADGHEFHLYPAADWVTGLTRVEIDKKTKKEREYSWLSDTLKEIGPFEITKWPFGHDFDINDKLRHEFRNHRLYTFNTEKALDKELTSIYRTARSSQLENGVSSLYLAVGLLRWFVETESQVPCYAPLILVPIEIVRKSANQGYALHERDEEPHFNTTLLEMLKQYYNINIPGVDPLPSDEHGIDIKKVFSTVRSVLFKVPNWDVVESCVIGNFSFAQFAMWNDIHTSDGMLENSDVVRSLIKGHVDWDVNVVDDRANEELYLPISVDSTQLRAIELAAKGKTFVLHGPPGTGKSQTITAMIANLMAQGKRVLFVAEKMAALTVVQKRLASLGIGDFCLELHSDKANKKQVLGQFEKTLSISSAIPTNYDELKSKDQDLRNRIDDYSKHLHKVQNCGISLRDLIAQYELVRDEKEYIRFSREEAGKLTKAQIDLHVNLISKLIATGKGVSGTIIDNPLKTVGLSSYSAEIRANLRYVIGSYRQSIDKCKNQGTTVAQIVGASAPSSLADLEVIKNLIDMFKDKKGADSLLVTLLKNGPDEVHKFFEKKEQFNKQEEILLREFKKDFLTMDMQALLEEADKAKKKFFGKASAMSTVTAVVQNYAYNPINFEQIYVIANKILAYQNEKTNIDNEFDKLDDVNKRLVQEMPSRTEFDETYNKALELNKEAEAFPGGLDSIIKLANDAGNVAQFEEFCGDLTALYTAQERFNSVLERRVEENAYSFDAELALCDFLDNHASDLKEWALYNQVRLECERAGLLPVIDYFEAGSQTNRIYESYRKGLYYALINNVIYDDDVLSCFSGTTFNETIEQFKRLDEELTGLAKREIYYKLVTNLPKTSDSPEVGMELNLLRKAIGSNARGMSIRNLFDRIPHIIHRLTPVMLMSPNSVAQYLVQDNGLFDVVIFDEASQLPTCKSVGALARANSAVIVGDPKQMPPTSFFAGSGAEVEDLALDDLDSILDDALALGIPSQHLQWHYRSTHESLIAFSNNYYYNNKMYTFPSANDRERHVTAVHVNGVYSKSVNEKEAEAIVAEIVRRFNDEKLRKQSIGVVTFNIKQQEKILNLLKKQFEVNPELDNWANTGEDALFVKNLENVQGDERDVILFSIGYGPDEKGTISMNFGPINKNGGGKRLNVAFSRARITMTIFTSVSWTDLKVTETSPEGLVAFRDFLKFAEGNDVFSDSGSNVYNKKISKMGIMQSICKEIKTHGFEYDTMVGHSDFRVDIAVVDPTNPDEYIMGIMLDGDGYKNTKNTRDREVSQIEVLKHLGWTLVRVWTIDWWDNREKQINRIMTQLNELKAKAEHRQEEKRLEADKMRAYEATKKAEEERVRIEIQTQMAELDAEEEELSVEVKEETTIDSVNEIISESTAEQMIDAQISDSEMTSLSEVDLGEDTSDISAGSELVSEGMHEVESETKNKKYYVKKLEFFEGSLPNLNATNFVEYEKIRELKPLVAGIVEKEAPISHERLIKVIFNACNIARSGKQVNDQADRLINASKLKSTKFNNTKFYWRADQNPDEYFVFRTGSQRTGEDLSKQELNNAICYILQDGSHKSKDELAKEFARLLGYAKITSKVTDATALAIKAAKSIGTITTDENKKFYLI